MPARQLHHLNEWQSEQLDLMLWRERDRERERDIHCYVDIGKKASMDLT